MLGKFAALLGPIIVGLVTFITDDSRLGILSISIFFIFGIILFSHSRKYNGINGSWQSGRMRHLGKVVNE